MEDPGVTSYPSMQAGGVILKNLKDGGEIERNVKMRQGGL